MSEVSTSNPEPALAVRDLTVRYRAAAPVLESVTIELPRGKIVSVLGPNGAGKSTTMRAISGLHRFHGGSIVSGSVEMAGQDITAADPTRRVRLGLGQALEGRQVFPGLSVLENLLAGAISRRRGRKGDREVLDRVLGYFPALTELLEKKAGLLSGGEQQMVAIGRALMSEPTVLLLDEPSLGLAPRIVEAVRDIIVAINASGTSILLVEQYAAMALSISDHAYILEGGRVVMQGRSSDLKNDPNIAALYLGAGTIESSDTEVGS